MKKKKIFQAGHVCHAGFNNWDICGYGDTIEEARKKLKELKKKAGKPEEWYGRYVEQSFNYEDWK